MKITIPICSRGRPSGLLSVLTSLDALATGQNDISYILITDTDDAETNFHINRWRADGMLPAQTHHVVEERNRTLNARVNEVIGAFPADVYCPLPDDGFPLTQHWDKFFSVLSQDLPAFAWQEMNDPGNATFIALTERWKRIAVFPDYFPFWFADTWILEVHLLAFAKGLPIVNQLSMGGKRGKTQGMRDLAFWFDFFARTRVERIAQAKSIARQFGFTLNMEERKEQLAILEEGSRNQMARVPHYERIFGANEGEPNEMYMAAKKRAEEWRPA